VAYLLDTNVLSEVVKKDADPHLVRWLSELMPASAFISVLTLGEIGRGVSMLQEGRRKAALRRWLEHDLPMHFRGRILPVDESSAAAWCELDADARKGGRPLPVVDGLLLATAKANRLTFVTRNETDCAGRGVAVVNPWREA
jgi:predicted nucleic acid-binding protein